MLPLSNQGDAAVNNIPDFLIDMLYSLPGIIIALTFHEWAHAYAALKMGDPTARNLGRLTLNPFAHIDVMGFLMMIVVGFGWAKPVPVNPRNYRSYKKGEIIVSLAGVTMNLILALVGTLAVSIIIKLMGLSIANSGSASVALNILINFVWINLCLMVFNLIPIYPLDGYHVAEVLLIKHIGAKPFVFMRKYGQYILIGILLIGRYSGFSPVAYLANLVMDGIGSLFGWLFGSTLISMIF